MKSIFIDANIILRILTKDDEKQMEKAESLFSKAISGDVLLVCGPPVLWVGNLICPPVVNGKE